MEEESRIKMSDKDQSTSQDFSKDLSQQTAEKGSTGSKPAPSGEAKGATPEDAEPEPESDDIQSKAAKAMGQAQESGMLNAEQLQDGSLQEKVKEAMEKGQAPGGFLSSTSYLLALPPLTQWGKC
jgi:hypothetical protein